MQRVGWMGSGNQRFVSSFGQRILRRGKVKGKLHSNRRQGTGEGWGWKATTESVERGLLVENDRDWATGVIEEEADVKRRLQVDAMKLRAWHCSKSRRKFRCRLSRFV